jgi:peptidoglycan/LPS O-acetylase OafA/YrhL
LLSSDRLLARLSRRTTSGRYLPEVDGLRFVAIMWVVLFHAKVVFTVLSGIRTLDGPFGNVPGIPPDTGLIGRLVDPGQFGVHIFFVVSGFVLALPFASHHLANGRPTSLRKYFARRLTRLEPPYLLALTLIFLVAVSGIAGTAASGLGPDYLAGLGYLHSAIFGELNPINGPVWSLEIEVQFYILAPLLALLFTIPDRRTRRLAMVLIAAIGAGAQALFVPGTGRLSLTVLGYLQFFMAGYLLADVFVWDWRERPAQHRAWDAIALLALGVFVLGFTGANVLMQAAFLPIVAFVLLVAAFRGPASRRVLTNRWVTTIGGMCYSIYLLHYPVLLILGTSARAWIPGTEIGILVLILAGVPLVIGLSVAFFALIERPCMEPGWPARLGVRVRSLVRRARGSAVDIPAAVATELAPVHPMPAGAARGEAP